MGTSREEMRQPVLGAYEKLPFAELHEDSIPEVAMNRQMCVHALRAGGRAVRARSKDALTLGMRLYSLRLLRDVGIADASMRDYIAPDPQRTKRILSALINFAKFREEKLAVYQELAAKTVRRRASPRRARRWRGR